MSLFGDGQKPMFQKYVSCLPQTLIDIIYVLVRLRKCASSNHKHNLSNVSKTRTFRTLQFKTYLQLGCTHAAFEVYLRPMPFDRNRIIPRGFGEDY